MGRREEGREEGRKGGREGGREGGKEGGREGGREGEGGRERREGTLTLSMHTGYMSSFLFLHAYNYLDNLGLDRSMERAE